MALVGGYKIVITNLTGSPITFEDVSTTVDDTGAAGYPTVAAAGTLEILATQDALVSWERGRIKVEADGANIAVIANLGAPTTAAPTATGVATASAEGVAITLARSDHKHQSNTAPTGLDASTGPTIGTSGEPARADHVHAISTGIPGVITLAAAPSAGAATSLARSDHKHQSNTAPANITKSVAVIGTSGEPARADHKHDTSTAAPATAGLGATSGEGSSTSLARADHTHQSNTAPADTTKAAAAVGSSTEPARADHKHDVTTAAPTATGVSTASGEGSATTLARSDHTHQSNTSPANANANQTSLIGVSGEPARADHRHNVPTAAPTATGVATASAVGTASTYARSDHTHQSNTAATAVGPGDAASVGTSAEPARADHVHAHTYASGFDAVVDTAVANGDYVLASAAFTAGHKRVLIRAGAYTEIVNIEIPEGGCLVAENPGTVEITLNTASTVLVDGVTGGVQYSTGTISVSVGSTTVTGVGTLFQTNSVAGGHYIQLQNIWYEISSVSSETVLILVHAYAGKAMSGDAYVAQNMVNGITISGITLKGSTIGGIDIRRAINVLIRDIIVEDCGSVVSTMAGVYILDSTEVLLDNVNVHSGPFLGAEIEGCNGARLQKCSFHNNEASGLLLNGVRVVQIADCRIDGNSDDGLDFSVLSAYVTVSGTTLKNNAGAGADLNNAYHVTLTNCVVAGNGGVGIGLLSSAQSVVDGCQISANGGDGVYCVSNSTVSDNIIIDNGGGGVNCVSADNSSVTGNRVDGNTGAGVEISSTTIGARVVGNSCVSNGTEGIRCDGDDCVVVGNHCAFNAAQGILIDTLAANNVVIGNSSVGNTGADYTDSGTGTLNSHPTTTAPADVTKAAAAIGVSGQPARADHKHDVTTAAPAAIGVGTASGEGTATTLARSDHSHQSSTTPTALTAGVGSAVGTSGQPARADHTHEVSTAAPAATGVSTVSGEGSASTHARSDHTHLSNTAPAQSTKAAAAIGTSGQPARADHKHDVSTAAATAATPGNVAAEGSATSLARSDHQHSLPAFGAIAATFTEGDDARLSDARTPTAHTTTHKHGGGDEVATATAAANAIPKAGAGGTLANGWVAESNVTQHEGAIDHNALANYVVAEHRTINDGATGTTDLWSADKISTTISAVSSGLDMKDPVATGTISSDGNIALTGEQTIRGVATSTSRVILTDQTAGAENGLWDTAAGAWSRPSDFDTDADVTNGAAVDVVDSNSTLFRYRCVLTTPDPIVIDTTVQTWAAMRPLDFGTTSGTAAEGNDSRIPTQDENDALAGTGTPSGANVFVTNDDARLSDARTPTAHNLGGAEHTADTLANLNLKVSDATLIDTGDSRLSDARTPTAHNLGGAEHSADTLANLNLKVSDATLIDTGDSRLSDARTPTAHASTHAPGAGGSDSIPTAAPAAVSLATAQAEGVAATVARSDHTHAAGTPPAQLRASYAAATGTSGQPARADHVHNCSTGAPTATGVATVSATGGSAWFARSDHKHQSNTAGSAATPGDAAAIGVSGEPARADHGHSLPAFGTIAGTFAEGDDSRFGAAPAAHAASHLPGGGDALATAAPTATGVATASAPGVAASFARSDHAHQSNTAATAVDPGDAAAIGTSGQPARADHVHAHTYASGFDAIVDTVAANGDYVLASTAFTAGHKRVLIRAGAYTEAANIDVPEDGCLVAEAPGSVVITMGTYTLYMGSNIGGVQYSTGTVTVAKGSTTVTGAGTLWVAAAITTGHFIKLESVWYEIASRTSDTVLVLVNPYQGRALAASSPYVAQNMHRNILVSGVKLIDGTTLSLRADRTLGAVIRDVTIEDCGSASGAAYIWDCGEVTLDNVQVLAANNIGLALWDCDAVQIRGCRVISCNGDGLYIVRGFDISISDCVFNANTGEGLYADGGGDRIRVSNSRMDGNGGAGAETNSVNSSFSNCSASYNDLNGFITLSSAESASYTGCTARDNDLAGFLIQSFRAALSSCHGRDNGTDGFTMVNADFSTVNGCVADGNGDNGVELLSSCLGVTVTGGTFTSNLGDGIQCAGDECIIVGNRCKANTGSGLNVTAIAFDTVVRSNNFGANTGTDYIDSGGRTDNAAVYASARQTVISTAQAGVFTGLDSTFGGTVVEDSASGITFVTTTGLFTVPTDGTYEVIGSFYITASASNLLDSFILDKNSGTTIWTGTPYVHVSTHPQQCGFSVIVELATTDTLRVRLDSNGGGTIQVNPGSTITVKRLG